MTMRQRSRRRRGCRRRGCLIRNAARRAGTNKRCAHHKLLHSGSFGGGDQTKDERTLHPNPCQILLSDNPRALRYTASITNQTAKPMKSLHGLLTGDADRARTDDLLRHGQVQIRFTVFGERLQASVLPCCSEGYRFSRGPQKSADIPLGRLHGD
jgi:hypothetical protein